LLLNIYLPYNSLQHASISHVKKIVLNLFASSKSRSLQQSLSNFSFTKKQ